MDDLARTGQRTKFVGSTRRQTACDHNAGRRAGLEQALYLTAALRRGRMCNAARIDNRQVGRAFTDRRETVGLEKATDLLAFVLVDLAAKGSDGKRSHGAIY